MKECWSEGDLRAYFDRELAPEEMERASAHLAGCPECKKRYEEIAGRAERVAAWIGALPGPAPVAAPQRRLHPVWKWVVPAAVAAAATIAVAIVGVPGRHTPPAPVARAVAPTPSVAAPPEEPAARSVTVPPEEPTVPVHEALVRPVRKTQVRPRRPATRGETFIALDNEPFEAGLVVRMALGPDQIQADVVFSADGRARAYRLVDERTN